MADQDFSVGDWLVRPRLARIERDGASVRVTPRSMAVLVRLAEAGDRVLSRNDLLDAVWPGADVTPDALSQCIVELRKAFRDDSRSPSVIETIPKIGVRLIAPVAVVPSSAAGGGGDTTGGAGPAAVAGTPARRGASTRAVAAAVLVVTGALGAAAIWFVDRRVPGWPDPLAGAVFRTLTDFAGTEEQGAISRDGRFVAFLSDHDGTWDVWLGQIGSGNFKNLTEGRVAGLRNPAVRLLGFSPDGSVVKFWTKTTDSEGGIVDQGWTVPIVGGELRRESGSISELDWSPDGKSIVYHPSAPGDPLFVAEAGETVGGTQIHVAEPSVHCHFPLWSRDGRSIYFVRGYVPDEMDVWRVAAGGGEAERLTVHNSRVSFPALFGSETLLYLATAEDGSGPWLHALELGTLTSHRIGTGSSTYTSISTSEDGRRIVATEARSTATLWRMPLVDSPVRGGDPAQIALRTPRGVSPGIGPGFVIYRAPKAGTDSVWILQGDGSARELWDGADGRVVAGPSLSADGQRLAFAVQREAHTRLYVMNTDGTGAHRIAEELDVRGAPSWSPRGEWIAVAAIREGAPRLFKVPTAGQGQPLPLGNDYALDPVWSPSGGFLVYSGVDVGTTFELKAVNVDGTPHHLPKLYLNRGSRRLDFLGDDEDLLVVLAGDPSRKEFAVIDLRDGNQRPLTDLGQESIIGDFDVAADGGEIVFDRRSEESDIVLVELRD